MGFPYVLLLSSIVCSGTLALGALLKPRRSVSQWAFCLGMLALMAEGFCLLMVARSDSPARVIYWLQWRFVALGLFPGSWLLFSLTYARGNAREFLARWRLVLAGAFAVPVALVAAYRDDFLIQRNDLTEHLWSLHLEPAGIVFYLCLLICSVLALMNFERTFRASVGTMRWRIKFMLLGVGVIFLTRVYLASQALLFHNIDPSLEVLNAGTVILATVLIVRSIFRAGQFDVDVYPSQLVLQGSVTALLAGIYLLLVGVLAKLVTLLGGDAAFALKSLLVLLALVVLAVLLQSDRVRLQLRRFVSRHFQRPLYDYRTAWKKFTDGTASCVGQRELGRSLVRMVADVFQALSVTIWLTDERKESLTLVASTSISETDGSHAAPSGTEAGEVIGHLQRHSEPVEIESSPERWAAALRHVHPSEFPRGGNRVCAPLVCRGELLGVMILGDRVGGLSFSQQDFDLLKCIADHAGASLLNVQLSERLLQARELEAFQTMAAFFVHDLKNAGSTLGLMLQNLPVHFDDPVFRQDALRGIAKTTDHINRLIGRLGLLRHELSIKTVESDLNEMAAQALTGMESGGRAVLRKELQALPRLRFDPEQMQKVLVNLVLNAVEASPDGAEVRVATTQIGRSAVLSVTDTGCGMSADFLNRSLFRPFQTTKKTGLGIGMFQSRMIVEAHGGKIAVASAPGKGTTFQVYLPLTTEAR